MGFFQTKRALSTNNMEFDFQTGNSSSQLFALKHDMIVTFGSLMKIMCSYLQLWILFTQTYVFPHNVVFINPFEQSRFVFFFLGGRAKIEGFFPSLQVGAQNLFFSFLFVVGGALFFLLCGWGRKI